MTINQAIAAADAMRPNAYTPDDKRVWVNQVERQLQEFTGAAYTFYTTADMDKELLLPEAWCDIYVLYIASMCDFWEQDTAKYNASAALYNGRLTEYKQEYRRSAAGQTSTHWVNLI